MKPLNERRPVLIKLVKDIARLLINIRVLRKARDQREVRSIRAHHDHVRLDVRDELEHDFHRCLVLEGEVHVGDVHHRDVPLAVGKVMQRLDPGSLVGAHVDVVDVGERRGLVVVQEGRGGQTVAGFQHAHGLLQRLRGRVFLEYIPADFAVFLYPPGEAFGRDLDMQVFNRSHGLVSARRLVNSPGRKSSGVRTEALRSECIPAARAVGTHLRPGGFLI